MHYYGVANNDGTASGPFKTHEEAVAFAQALGGNNENVYVLQCSDVDYAERRLSEALERYQNAYRDYEGDARDILEAVGLPTRFKDVAGVLESTLRSYGTLTPEWYYYAVVRPIDVDDYDNPSDWMDDCEKWFNEADSLAYSLYRCAVYLAED